MRIVAALAAPFDFAAYPTTPFHQLLWGADTATAADTRRVHREVKTLGPSVPQTPRQVVPFSSLLLVALHSLFDAATVAASCSPTQPSASRAAGR